MKNNRLDRNKTIFAVIDIQTRLLPVVEDSALVEENAAKLIKGGRVLGLDILVTQQYTKGIGPTTDDIKTALGEFDHIEKRTFSAMKTEEFISRLKETNSDTVVLCGIETHICVQQTALDLLKEGYKVFIAADCVSSRRKEAKDIALEGLEAAGATLMTHEAILFELLETSAAPEFKAISAIIK